ncbi:MAG: TonB-dependent receptor plug domain-containing protein [Rhodoferax sp.]
MKVLPPVEVVGSIESLELRKESIAPMVVIDEAEVERFGDATVGDVLRRVVGISITGPAGVSKDARMRGLDKGYTQFLINGEAVPGAVQERQMQVDRLPADMIERIEILRVAPASMPAQGIGGTINIVLKQSSQDYTRLRLAAGKNGTLDVGDAVVQWNHTHGDWNILLAASRTVGAEDVVENKETLSTALAVTARENKPKPVTKSENLLTPRFRWHSGTHSLTIDPYLSEGTESKFERTTTTSAAGATTKLARNQEDKRDRLSRVGLRWDERGDAADWFLHWTSQQGSSGKDKSAPTQDLTRVAAQQWSLSVEREDVT